MLSLLAISAVATHRQHKFLNNNNDLDSGLTSDEKPDIYDFYDLYLTMFLKGAKVIPRVENTDVCVNATRDSSRLVGKSVDKIKTKGFNFDTYLETTNAISKAQPTIETCFDPSFEVFKKSSLWFGSFKSTLSFVKKFFVNALFSFYRWIEISKAYIDAIAKGDIPRIYYISGRAIFTLFDFDGDKEIPASLSNEVNHKELTLKFFSSMYDLFYHFLDGARILDGERVDFCEGNLTEYKNTFNEATKEIKKGTDESIKKGIYGYAQLVGEFDGINILCVAGLKDSIDVVNQYLRIRTAPLEIIHNFIWNYRKVYKHMMQSVECIFSGDAKCVGFNSGSLFYQIFAKHK